MPVISKVLLLNVTLSLGSIAKLVELAEQYNLNIFRIVILLNWSTSLIFFVLIRQGKLAILVE